MIFPEVKIFDHDVYYDHRGEIWTLWKKDEYPDIDLIFNHDKISTSRKNVLRGLHGDTKSWKLMECIHGDIYFVVVDNRPNSPNYLKWDWMMLTDKKRQAILLPPNFANGILVMSDLGILHYKWSYVGEYPDVNEQFTIKWDNPSINIFWGHKNNFIIQKRDF